MANVPGIAAKDLVKVREIIMNDAVALDRWPRVIDYIITTEVDRRCLKMLLVVDRQYAEAILRSLQIWHSFGTNRADLFQVLHDHGLNALAEKLMQQQFGTNPGIWFEIGELPHNFTGRSAEILRLYQMFMETRTTESVRANIVLISGLGGIGKSTLARKYVFTYKHVYDSNVVWINAETIDSMQSSFSRLAKKLGIKVNGKEPYPEIVTKVYSVFNDKVSLFVFDNVVERGLLQQFLPRIVNPESEVPHVLLTSRRIDLIPIKKNQLHLDVLTMDEAVEFILGQLHSSNMADALKLADKLQRLPLALQQAVAYIRDKYLHVDDECVSRYLKELDKFEEQLLNDEKFKYENDYSLTTFITWRTTLERIEKMEHGPLAIKLIRVLSYLNPDFVSIEFVKKIFQEETEAALKILYIFSMVIINEVKVSIHPLVQHVIRLGLNPEEEQSILEFIIKAIADELGSVTKFTNLKRECISHGLHLFPFQVKHEELMKGNFMYLSNLCYYLTEYGNYEDSLSIAQQSASTYESLDGNEHESSIRMKWRTAHIHYYLDNCSNSTEILESILPVSKTKFGQDHGLTKDILKSIARNHSILGKNVEAIKIYDEIIALQIKLHGEVDPEVLAYQIGKAGALWRLDKLDEASELYHSVYEKYANLFGKHDVRTLNARLGIADVTKEKGELKKALEMYKYVYEGFKEMVGEVHRKTIIVKNRIEKLENKLTK